MKRTLAVCAFTSLLLSTPALACTFEVNTTLRPDGNSRRLFWSPVAGATEYEIFEATRYHDFRKVDQLAQKTEPAFIARPTATEHQNYEYLILARSDNSEVSCVGTISFEMNGDDKLGAVTHKRIVPLVGSVRGAFGSDFRTSLNVRFFPGAKGRIVFRPTATSPSDSDPSLRYAFGFGPEEAHDLYWDDVVAAMGATGTGTLEILPEATPGNDSVYAPEINARVYNVTPGGSFGADVAAVHPAEWIRNPEANASFSIPPARPNYRRNAGIRTITTLLYRLSVQLPNQPPTNSGLRELPANYTWFGSIDALVGSPVDDNARVTVSFLSGNAIGFYTETENRTNDPIVVIKSPTDVAAVSWSY